MKRRAFVDFARCAVVVGLVFAVAAAVNALAPAQAVTPCTYVGRIMNAEHVAFDENFTAEIIAYNQAGKKIAATKTFHKPETRRNYALRIPMASYAVGGALTPGSRIGVKVKTPDGIEWSGVIEDKDLKIGGPGSVKEVDIVLASCTNPYDVDDELLDAIYDAWYYSDYNVPGETFDPLKDYDGDGMSTVAEVLAGTDPFDSEDCLTILSYERGETKRGTAAQDAISFTCRSGRSYRVEVSDSLDKPNWTPVEFTLDGTGTPINSISIPNSDSEEGTAAKVYLLPSPDKKKAFYRIKAD